jgi:hypothetical protein
MIRNNPTNVEAAFEILLEQIQAEIDFVKWRGRDKVKLRRNSR